MDKGIPPSLARQLPNLRDHGRYKAGKRQDWALTCSAILKAGHAALRRSRHNGASARRTGPLRTGRTQMDKGIPPPLARQLPNLRDHGRYKAGKRQGWALICSSVLKAEPTALRCACHNSASARQAEPLKAKRTMNGQKAFPASIGAAIAQVRRGHGG